MATLERKEVKEQAKSALTAKEKNVIKKSCRKKGSKIRRSNERNRKAKTEGTNIKSRKTVNCQENKGFKTFSRQEYCDRCN